jgi:hypothetical protein
MLLGVVCWGRSKCPTPLHDATQPALRASSGMPCWGALRQQCPCPCCCCCCCCCCDRCLLLTSPEHHDLSLRQIVAQHVHLGDLAIACDDSSGLGAARGQMLHDLPD